ncbi:ATP-binding protein [Desulfosporosinus nitroreducens]|uniref:ATP-binding protein n=1 Tax=Desulfosporosinus nitroreducens TaxID=2018668 RepID=UPI00207CBE69|nr:ATP-binding protein [Desulfosporosinus nitroreducens]MCO1602246.1 ATP-binding protein [Desulfosporosinus nitroreducens]
MEQYKLGTSLLALDSLSIYRGLLDDEVLSRLKSLISCLNQATNEFRDVVNLYNNFYFELAKSGTVSLQEYIIDKIVFDENPFTFKLQAVQTSEYNNSLEKAVANDLKGLQQVSKLTPGMLKAEITEIFANDSYKTFIEGLPDWVSECQPSKSPAHIQQIKELFSRSNHWDECLDELNHFYKNYGCGLFARYIAFVWEKSDGQGYLKGIDSPDPITLNELVEYQNERSRVIENTLQFLKGFPSNNVLLYGDRGTGKSSTVKAILNHYHTQGLRMVEVPKAYLADFPLIIRHLKNRAQKFIIFVDDLVFGDNEENYTSLKAVLEGGLESKTSNILIYATSNRRHLVKEYFSERAGLHSGNHNEEVHAGDSMQEKLSLADRFGINVVFSSPDQNRYLKIVEGIASSRNLKINKERLQREALQWALWYNGRSARTARQFVDWIEGHDSLKDQND